MLEYRRNADETRSLHVVGPVDGIPLFTGTGAPTPRLEAGLAEAKAGDFDGDGRDDLAIAFGGCTSQTPGCSPDPTNGAAANAYVGVVSFTQDLGVRGQQYSAISSDALFTDSYTQRATRGLRLAPRSVPIRPERRLHDGAAPARGRLDRPQGDRDRDRDPSLTDPEDGGFLERIAASAPLRAVATVDARRQERTTRRRRSAGRFLLGKAAVMVRRFERPLAAEMDERRSWRTTMSALPHLLTEAGARRS
jgi:hypothetical protein